MNDSTIIHNKNTRQLLDLSRCTKKVIIIFRPYPGAFFYFLTDALHWFNVATWPAQIDKAVWSANAWLPIADFFTPKRRGSMSFRGKVWFWMLVSCAIFWYGVVIGLMEVM
ncbi:hypothetical protein P5G64_05735 [Serratia nevei]|nr:hypothetical protein [Serratia nevei]MDF8337015.1 hypothetical protein [Serratia nevei]MDF8345384.1 hypothetical protein [Serratia nevei]MDF8348048.1 hypothetical protein [Serratia nevei]